MQNFLSSKMICKLNVHRQRLLIICSWIFGLLTGFMFALNTPWSFISFAAIAESTGSPVSGFLVKFLTLLLGYITCLYSRPLLCVLLYLKGLTYGIASVNLLCTSAGAGWLIHLLLMLTDTILILVILFLALRTAGQSKRLQRNETILFAFASVFVVILDSCFLIPFSNLLLNS